jgi:hypothetical protein
MSHFVFKFIAIYLSLSLSKACGCGRYGVNSLRKSIRAAATAMIVLKQGCILIEEFSRESTGPLSDDPYQRSFMTGSDTALMVCTK